MGPTARKSSGFRVMEKRAPARSRPYCSPEKKPSFTPAWPRMNENSPIWARPAATTRPVRNGWARSRQRPQREHRLAQDDQAGEGGHLGGVGENVGGVHEHAHRHEEQHRERFAERHQVGAHLVAEGRLVDDHPGQEGPEGEGHPELVGREQREAGGDREHDEQEQLARPRARDEQKQPRHEAGAHEEHEADEGGRLEEHRSHGGGQARAASGQGRQQEEEHDGGEVLEDEPTHRGPPGGRIQQALVHQPPQEHHRAGDGKGETEQEAGRAAPAPESPQAVPERRGQRHLREAPGDRDRAHPPQVLQGEVEADPEHQEDHAQLGQLGDGLHVAHEARRVGADGHARQQVAHDGGHAGQAGQEAAQERRSESDGDVGEKGVSCMGARGRSLSRRLGRSAGPALDQLAERRGW